MIKLILAVFLGGITGIYLPDIAQQLKPVGDIFLNLMLIAIIPLIFFSVSSAIVKTGSIKKFGKTMLAMFLIFLVTGTIAALYAIATVKLFPINQNTTLQESPQTLNSMFDILSKINIFALIVFSMVVGLVANTTKRKRRLFANFLQAGEKVLMKVFTFIMYFAPIGFFAYFATITSQFGHDFVTNYLHVMLIYYISGIIYFIFVFSIYAYIAGKWTGIKLFWKNIFLPAVTGLATCSSAASIPANLTACQAMRIPSDIYETTIPLGTIIHKQGSIIGGIFKIAFLFGIFHLDFSGALVLLIALGVSLLVGTVMGAIPSGGMLGELVILAAYGFPASVLVAVAAISILIDPLATMLNVTGNTISTLLIANLRGTTTNAK